jgi:hypothetical protein
MDHTEYRKEFAAYQAELQQALYEYQIGNRSHLSLDYIHDRYDDLWREESIAKLQSILDEISSMFETEQRALQTLINAAKINLIEKQTRDLSNEIKLCEASAHILLEDTRVSIKELRNRIANEKIAKTRHDLAKRLIDALRVCDDLRAEHIDALEKGAIAIGQTSYSSFYSKVTNTDFSKLLDSAHIFMEQTAPLYRSQLSRMAAYYIPNLNFDELTTADFLYLKQASQLEHLFPTNAALRSFTSMLGNLGIRIDQQKSLRIYKREELSSPYSRCFPISITDIRLLTKSIGGLHNYVDLFQVGGEAEHYAWSSGSLIEQYPEFFYSPDRAANKGHGLLFGLLFQDSIWLSEHGGFSIPEAQKIVRTLAIFNVHNIRRSYASLSFSLQLYKNLNSGSEQLSNTYAEEHREATVFQYNRAAYLIDADLKFESAETLRAWTFAVGLLEHLRIRFGRRWWSKEQARDLLIDLWNTASRYKVEELAKLIGIGELSFELLAETTILAMSEGA